MSLANYSDLTTAIGTYMKRDVSTYVADWIALAETRINGDLDIRLQDTATNLSTTASTETLAVPTDIINTRSLTVTSTSPYQVLRYTSPDQSRLDNQYAQSGTPREFTVIGANFYLAPIPDAIYTVQCIYKAKVPALTSTNTTTYLMTSYPQVYLYATLLAGAIFYKDTEKIAAYERLYSEAIRVANAVDWYSGSTMRVKPDVSK